MLPVREGKLQRRLGAVAILLVLGAARGAAADVTIDSSASILVWPKIISDGTHDTVIQLSNTSNSVVRAHCFYVNAALTDPSQPPGPLNPPLWLETDFDIVLTRQQPSYWYAHLGRTVDPSDNSCDPRVRACRYRGFDPGLIPPVPPGFEGELKCVQVDDSGAPLSGNNLIGEATIVRGLRFPPESGDVVFTDESNYTALGILGIDNNGDGELVLGGGQCAVSGDVCGNDEDCGDAGPCVLEYNACPAAWILNHPADGAPDTFLNQVQLGEVDATIHTELTIVPCTQNFETQVPTTVTVQFLSWNEFESQFSVSTSITCWGNFRLADIGAPALTIDGQPTRDKFGTMFMQTRMRSAAGSPYGMLMVAEEFHASKPSRFSDERPDIIVTRVGVGAANLHVEGQRTVPDLITIPADQVGR